MFFRQSAGNQLIWVDHRYYWYTCVFHFLGVPAGIQAAYAIVPQHVCWGISSNGILHLKVHVSLHFLHLSFCCVVIVLLQPTSPLIFWSLSESFTVSLGKVVITPSSRWTFSQLLTLWVSVQKQSRWCIHMPFLCAVQGLMICIAVNLFSCPRDVIIVS